MQRVGNRASALTGQPQSAADSDAMLVGVGSVLFWPALFFLGGDDAQANELGRLRGEHEALQQAGIEKECFNSEETAIIQQGQ